MNIQGMREVSATELAEQTGDTINRVFYSQVPSVVIRRGKPIVALLPVDPETGEILLEQQKQEQVVLDYIR